MAVGAMEHACPQCGAPVELEDTSALFDCPFCRVRLAILHGGAPAFYLAPRPEFATAPIFVPYWRLRGLVLAADLPGVQGKLFDATLLARADLPTVPPSLGLRPQAMPLRFVEPHTHGVVLPPTETASPLRRAQTHAQGRLTACLAEATALIFQPLALVDGRLIDGISGDDLGAAPVPFPPTTESYSPQLAFQPAICPQCATELAGEAASRVQLCYHCQTVWEITEHGVVPCLAHFVPSPPEGTSLWLPFWTIEVRSEGFALQTWADLVELTGLPRVIQPWMKTRAFFFRIPAFKIRPDLFVLLTQQASLSPLPAQPPTTLPREPLYPVSLALAEANRSIGVALAALAPARKRLFTRIQGGRIRPVTAHVEYLPFLHTPTDLLQPDLNFALPASALTWARSL